jgi:hypothetical protein
MQQNIKDIYKKIIPTKLRYLVYSLRQLSNNQNVPREIANLKKDLLFFQILHHFKNNDATKYQDELNYINQLGTLALFPYNRTSQKIDDISAGFDKQKMLPFVMHKDKKLYFPKRYSVTQARDEYLCLVVNENLLADKYWEKTPHQYITEDFFVKDGDIVLDVGASEGLFLLDVIDKIKKGYLFEPDKVWLAALEATFAPYKDKVTIIKKFAADKDLADEITIDTFLKNEDGNIFIKIDVEGNEKKVLDGAQSVLKRKNDIRVACCTYHQHDDASLFEKFFNDLNYHLEFSDGFMLFYFYGNLKPPYFRKGLIRAKNTK